MATARAEQEEWDMLAAALHEAGKIAGYCEC
jgi:hypothetical protein